MSQIKRGIAIFYSYVIIKCFLLDPVPLANGNVIVLCSHFTIFMVTVIDRIPSQITMDIESWFPRGPRAHKTFLPLLIIA